MHNTKECFNHNNWGSEQEWLGINFMHDSRNPKPTLYFMSVLINKDPYTFFQRWFDPGHRAIDFHTLMTSEMESNKWEKLWHVLSFPETFLDFFGYFPHLCHVIASSLVLLHPVVSISVFATVLWALLEASGVLFDLVDSQYTVLAGPSPRHTVGS